MKTVTGTAEELSVKAAGIIAQAIEQTLKEKNEAVLAIVGGRSVGAIFERLKDEKAAWEKVRLFFVDERKTELDSSDSNYSIAKKTFLDKLAEENIHPFTDVKKYEEEIKEHGGSYDIALLSSGEDGHVGALFPNHHSVKDDAEYYLEMDDSPKPPAKRMTSSRKLMMRSKIALILFIGEGKREAYEKFKSGDDVIECPARMAKKIEKSYVLTNLTPSSP